jgi:hypothetical protein
MDLGWEKDIQKKMMQKILVRIGPIFLFFQKGWSSIIWGEGRILLKWILYENLSVQEITLDLFENILQNFSIFDKFKVNFWKN